MRNVYSHILKLVRVLIAEALLMPNTGLEISTHPLAPASVKTTEWASTNPRLFVAFIKGTHPVASAVKMKFPFL